jgi:hypothetical protein
MGVKIMSVKRECHAEWLEHRGYYRVAVYDTSKKYSNGDTIAFVDEDELDNTREWAKANGFDKLIIDK